MVVLQYTWQYSFQSAGLSALGQQSPPSNWQAAIFRLSSQYPSPAAPGPSVGQDPGFGPGPGGGEGAGPGAGGALTPSQAFGAAIK